MPRSRASAAIWRTGCSVPTSLLTSMTETSRVFGFSAAATDFAVEYALEVRRHRKHRRMLDFRHDDMHRLGTPAKRALRRQRAFDGPVVPFGSAGRERYLIAVAVDHPRHLFARERQRLLGLLRHPVFSRGVCELRLHQALRLHRLIAHRSGG